MKSRYKILTEKPKLDPAIISNSKDFRSILDKVDIYNRKVRIRKIVIGAGIVLGILATILFFLTIENSNYEKIKEEPVLIDSLNFDQQENKKKPIEIDSIEIDPTKDVSVQEKTAIDTSSKLNPTFDPSANQPTIIPETTNLSDSASEVPEQLTGKNGATPKSGFRNLYQYLNEEISNAASTYSEIALDSISIKVMFTITYRGAIQNVNIVKSDLNDLLNQKVIEIIENMPEWKPASINGEPINSTFSLPIKIIIK